jgi:hypothetical protein
MEILESLLVAVAEAIAQAVLTAIIAQAQQPSTANDGYVDPNLISRIKNEIEHPNGSD